MSCNLHIKGIIKWLGISVAALIVFLIAVFGFAQTQAGKQQVAAMLAAALSKRLECHVTFGKLDGLIPFSIRLEHLTVADEGGGWLTIEDAILDWSARGLIRGRLHITELSAAAIKFTRVPQARKIRKPNKIELSTWLNRLPCLVVDRLAVGHLSLGSKVLGESAVFTLKGQIMAFDPVADRVSSVYLERIDGVEAQVVVTATLKGKLPVLSLHAEAREPTGRLFAAASGDSTSGPIAFTLHGEGPVTAWKGKMSASVGHWGDLVAEIGVSVPDNLHDLRLTVDGRMQFASCFLPPKLAPLLGSRNHFTLTARLTQTKSLIMDHLMLETGAATFHLSGSLDLKAQQLLGDFALQCDDLLSLEALVGPELKGALCVEGRFSGALYEPEVALTMKLTGLETAKLRAGLIEGDIDLELLGPLDSSFAGVWISGNGMAETLSYAGMDPMPDRRLAWSLNVKLTEATHLTLSDIVIEAPAARFTAKASLDFSNNTLGGHWRLLVPQLHALSQGFKHPVGGSLQVDGEIGGSMEMAKLTMKATGHDILMGGVNFGQIGLTFLAEGLPERPRGNLSLDLCQGEHSLNGTTDFVLEGKRLTFSRFLAQGAGSELMGNLALDLDRLVVEGNLGGDCKDLSRLAVLLGKKLGGEASLQVSFEPSGTGQKVDIQLVGRDLASPFGYAEKVRLGVCLTDAFKSLRGSAQIEIKDFKDDELTFATLSLSAAGDPKHIAFKGRAGGHYGTALVIEADGIFDDRGEGMWFKVNRLQGDYGGFPVAIERPVTVERVSKGYSLDELLLSFGSGSIEASGSIVDEQLNLTVDLERMPLSALCLAGAPDLSGLASGHMVATGKADQPEVQVELDFTGIQLPASDFPLLSLAAEAKLQEGRLCAKLTLEGLAEKPVEAMLDLPVAFSLSPFGFSLPSKGALKGHLAGNTNLAWVNSLLALDDQSLEGRIEVMCDVNGTVAEPEITGRAHLKKGVYENVRSGTILKNLDVKLATKGSRLIIERAQGTDGNEGTVSVQGWLDLLPDKDFPFQLDFSLQNAALLRLDEATATASGQFTLSGSSRELLAAGKLNVGPAEIRIPDRLPPEMTQLEIIEIYRDGQEKKRHPSPKPTLAPRLLFDVALESPGRVFVRGRGLDAECEGDFRITGSAHEPVITGRLSVVRGHYSFLGKRFSLEKANLSFDGTVPPTPYLDVTGEAKADEMTVLLDVSGPISAPEMSLTSNPALPEDEVLSHLLFGQNVAEITAMQAVQLAYAVRTLSGSGSGWDIMGSARNLLGVDQLEIKKSGEESSEVSIGAGKYLTERVYLEVEQGLGPGNPKGTVEVELTPNITLETQVGGDSDPGIGIRWKRDY